MSQPITDIAVMHDTSEIVAAGSSFHECWRDAEATGIWPGEPGSVAPYFFTSAEAKEFFRAWYREGFWDEWKRRQTEAAR